MNSQVPIVKKSVRNHVVDGTLVIELNSETFHCSKNQGIIWAICAGGFANLEQLVYQLESVPEFDCTEPTHDYLSDTITMFVDKGFMHIFDEEPIVHPIDLREFSHFASSRGGIYAFNQKGYQRIAHGMFFGLCFDQRNNLLAFDFPHLKTSTWRLPFNKAKNVLDSNEGVARKFNISDGILISENTELKNLANNCHYLIREGDNYYAVDTERQCILEITPDYAIKQIPTFDNAYHHINGLAKISAGWLLMRSINSPSGIASGFAYFDDNWKLIDQIDLPAERAHDFLVTNGSRDKLEFWYCDSNNNQIKHYPSGELIAVAPHLTGNNTTRGLSDTDQHWVVGNGRYGRYYGHLDEAPELGAVSFIDKTSNHVDYHFTVPEAPCCIVKNPWFIQQKTTK